MWKAKLTIEHGFFLVQLVAYTLWLALHFLIVNVLGQQRLLRDPEVISYRGSKSLIHVHCVPSLVYCSSHGTYSPHPVILIACDFPNTKCFCICMEWWKLSARCNA